MGEKGNNITRRLLDRFPKRCKDIKKGIMPEKVARMQKWLGRALELPYKHMLYLSKFEFGKLRGPSALGPH